MAKANDKKAAKAPAKAAAKASPKAAPMSRGEVVDTVAAQVGLTRTQADDAIKAYESTIQRALVSGGEVRLPGFGSFKTGHRAARSGRNPLTGEALTVAASTTVKFSASAALKGAVNGNSGNKSGGNASKGGASKGGASKGGSASKGGGASKGAAKGASKGAAKGASTGASKGASKGAAKKGR